MKLYVTTCHKYNSGYGYGKYLDLDDYCNKDEFLEACYQLHNDESDPEFMFIDYVADNKIEELFYDQYSIDDFYWEYESQCEGYDLDLIGEYIDYNGYNNIEEGIEKAIENYTGVKGYSEGECIQEYVEMTDGNVCNDLPSYIANNIDWDGVAEDFKGDFDFIYSDHKYYLFTCN